MTKKKNNGKAPRQSEGWVRSHKPVITSRNDRGNNGKKNRKRK